MEWRECQLAVVMPFCIRAQAGQPWKAFTPSIEPWLGNSQKLTSRSDSVFPPRRYCEVSPFLRWLNFSNGNPSTANCYWQQVPSFVPIVNALWHVIFVSFGAVFITVVVCSAWALINIRDLPELHISTTGCGVSVVFKHGTISVAIRKIYGTSNFWCVSIER
jgi:hypothetical protein